MVFTEKARLKAVLAQETTDRPPVICPGGMMSAATKVVLSTASGSFHTDAVIMAKIAEAIRQNLLPILGKDSTERRTRYLVENVMPRQQGLWVLRMK